MTTQTPAVADNAGASAQSTWTCVLFDLDGTLTDSAPGIVDRIARALIQLGRPIADKSDLFSWVGPPMLESFEQYGFTPNEAIEALDVYRGISEAEGPWSGSSVYAGVPELLAHIKASGIPLAVASSKPEYQVAQVIEHFDLKQYFDIICGASADETVSAKADVIAEALRRLHHRGVDLTKTLYVGDRIHDVEGATAHGLPVIIVDWGYGTEAEAQGAIAHVSSAAELETHVLG
ncbi:HAD hydrolase-like protein [Paramicrobacterium chengjingii]|uniref:HAD hydrolase-like protein n=1 Tax=Paramicrobacterium chengjingii TaxID=2769067 RepID=UPI001422E48D|nr:HAD hydrolase-like protein [Microbacterium chengjingii]